MENEAIHIQEAVHTERMQDIIGTPPRWLYRWGITVLSVIALMCLVVSASIDYPESVKTKIEILGMHSPLHIAAKDSSSLIKILEPNDVPVKRGQDLAIISSGSGETALKAPLSGELTYANIIHEDQQLVPGQDIFLISTGHNDFYGKVAIPQTEFRKVKPGQMVVVNLGNLAEKPVSFKGIVRYIIDGHFKNGQCFAEVDFDTRKREVQNNLLLLKNGMIVDADIITANATLLHRLVRSLTRGIK